MDVFTADGNILYIESTLWDLILVAVIIKLAMNCTAKSFKLELWLSNFLNSFLCLKQNKRT